MEEREWSEAEFEAFMTEQIADIDDAEIEAEANRILAEAENDPDYQSL